MLENPSGLEHSADYMFSYATDAFKWFYRQYDIIKNVQQNIR